MLNITQIPAPRVPLIDERTGLISREWFRFFNNIYLLTGSGNNQTSLDDLQVAPTNSVDYEIIKDIYHQAQLGGLQSVQLGTLASENADNVRLIGFSVNPSPPIGTAPVGTAFWDGGTTLNLQMTTNVTQPVGEATYFYIKASAAISKGQLIMFDGAVGASGVLKGKPATGLTDGQYLMGVASEDIANNGFGLIQNFGLVRGFDTSGTPYGEVWADGDILYYSPSFPGGLTKTLPSAPNIKATIAVVVNAASGGSGSIFTRLSVGSVLGGTDSNVQFGTLTNMDMILYDATNQYWVNKPASTVQVLTWLGM